MMQVLPLVMVYFIFPAIGITGRFLGVTVNRLWLDVVWIILFLFTTLIAFVHCKKVKKSAIITIFLVLLWVFAHVLVNIIVTGTELIPVLMEIKPFFYIIFAWLWVTVWGPPREMDFVKWGRVLSLLLIGELVITVLMEGKILRVKGSGEINYDAMLLLIAICFVIIKKASWRVKDILLFVGVLVTLSRTALISVVILLLTASTSKILKIITIGANLIGICFSFKIRDLPMILKHADRYWMWVTGLQMYLKNPLQTILGFGLTPLNVAIPPQLYFLWVELQQAKWHLSGIYAYNFHAFWLRFTTSWGLILTFITIAVLSDLFIRAPRSRPLVIIFVIEGLTMGTLYLSNVGIVLVIAMMVAQSNSRVRRRNQYVSL